MKTGDVVRKHGEDNLMTIEKVETTPFNIFVHVLWFDKDEKLRKLRFFATDLILVARVGDNMVL